MKNTILTSFLAWLKKRFWVDGEVNFAAIVAICGAILVGFGIDPSTITSWHAVVVALHHAVSTPQIFFGGIFTLWAAFHDSSTLGLGDGFKKLAALSIPTTGAISLPINKLTSGSKNDTQANNKDTQINTTKEIDTKVSTEEVVSDTASTEDNKEDTVKDSDEEKPA